MFGKIVGIVFIGTIFMMSTMVLEAEAGVGIPGHGNGPTPFQDVFATGFSGSYNTYGTGTTAGAIGAYGRFVSGGAQGGPHGGGGYGK